jgi:hypothetical protein
VSLEDEIGQFGSLVGLLLALATLLTANRASRLAELERAPDFSGGDRARELVLDALLAAVTALVFLGGLPLAVRALRDLHPLAEGGPLRSVFVLAWALLVGLVAWQAGLVLRALRLRPPP